VAERTHIKNNRRKASQRGEGGLPTTNKKGKKLRGCHLKPDKKGVQHGTPILRIGRWAGCRSRIFCQRDVDWWGGVVVTKKNIKTVVGVVGGLVSRGKKKVEFMGCYMG